MRFNKTALLIFLFSTITAALGVMFKLKHYGVAGDITLLFSTAGFYYFVYYLLVKRRLLR